jgi:hypothetical protein
MIFDPSNCFMKIWESIETPTPKVGAHLGVCGLIPLHSLAFLKVNVTPRLHSWPAPFHAPCFGREPKVRVVTFDVVFPFV